MYAILDGYIVFAENKLVPLYFGLTLGFLLRNFQILHALKYIAIYISYILMNFCS